MSNEISFIKDIKKRECLYNHNLPEYNRRDESEQAWAEVAKRRNLTVTECKDKWRNIRSSFLRSLKKTDKVKKPYYLSPYLQFVLPFTKFSQECSEDVQKDESRFQISQDNELEIQTSPVKFEQDSEDRHNPFKGVEELFEPDMLNDNFLRRNTSPDDRASPIPRRRRRKMVPTDGESKTMNLKRRQSSYTTYSQPNSSSSLNNSSMRYFLLSLLPDFETMTEEQIRIFKIQVMMLLDEIKSNVSEVRSYRQSGDTERLQKRLINLLLRNLKKT